MPLTKADVEAHPRPTWIVVYDGTRPNTRPFEMHCLRCGGRYAMTLPVETSVWLAAATQFQKNHWGCR